MNIGNKVLKKIKEEISNKNWNRYMKNLTYSEKESKDTFAQFYAPNVLLSKWIKTKYQSQLIHLFELETKVKPHIVISIDKYSKNKRDNKKLQQVPEQSNQSKRF